MSLWKRKPIDQLLNEASESEKGLKRTLTAKGLTALGIGAIIGAGLFSITGIAAATNAGPAITISIQYSSVNNAIDFKAYEARLIRGNICRFQD